MMGNTTQARRGVTLTEILISIMILGVGMVSLATLFPIGLLRIRDATRNSRSALLSRNAGAELQARNLFDPIQFPFPSTYTFNPWLQDGPAGGTNLDYITNPTTGPSFPVAYDPLWFNLSGQRLPGTDATRFGRNIGLRQTTADGTTASAYGLQRISNVVGALADQIFVSPDDLVYQTEGANGGASPLVPDLSGGLVNDYAYSWMFTGQQSDANEYTVFDGSVVVHNNRAFGLDGTAVAGERVVEGVFGYGFNSQTTVGYSTGNPRLVLLRWPSTEPDPEVALGSWIADVTYEQVAATSTAKSADTSPYPMQRCYWYRVAKRSVPTTETIATVDYRRMLVTLTDPVRAKTLLSAGSTTTPTDLPYYANAALLCPSVVNVFPRVIYTRD